MMLLFISTISLGLFYVMGAPQLKLGHSGYEIIPMNDQNPDDSLPLASKLTLEGASRYNGIGALNLEKATDSIDEDDGLSLPPQQHKRHYDAQQSPQGKKDISGSQSNTINFTSKQSWSRKPNVYLPVGIPRSLTHPTTGEKEAQSGFSILKKTNENPQPKGVFDDSDSREEPRNQEKIITSSIHPKISEKRPKDPNKLSKESIDNTLEKIRNQESEREASAMFESDFELADLKDEEKFTSLVSDAHRALGLIDAASDAQIKSDRVEPRIENKGFITVTHFPSIQIHHRKTSFLSHKRPSLFSPIFPSGIEILAGVTDKKSVDAIKEYRGSRFRVDHKTTKDKKNGEMQSKDRNTRFLLGHQFREIRPGSKEFGKSYQDKTGHGFPSVLLLNNVNHEPLNPGTGSIIPMSVTQVHAQPLLFTNQENLQPMRHSLTHLEMNSIPLITSHSYHSLFPTTDASILHPQLRWDKTMPRTSIDLSKRHRQGKDFDQEHLDSNHMLTKSQLQADFVKNFVDRLNLPNPESTPYVESMNELLPPNFESSKGLIITGIVQDIAPDDSLETVIDAKKQDGIGEGHGMLDPSHSHSSASPRNSCKQMKPCPAAFYEFLVKFSNNLLGKALQYESYIQARDNSSKLIETTKK